MNKKQLLALLSAEGAIATATIIGPKPTLTEWPALEAELIAKGWKLRTTGAVHAVYDEPNSNRYIMKPVIPRVRTGEFKARSSGAQYVFEWQTEKGMQTSRGTLTDLKVNETGTALDLAMSNGNTVSYELSTKGNQS